MTNAEVAEALGVSGTTIKRHLANVYPKLGVHSRSGAVVVALRSGLLPRRRRGAQAAPPRGTAARRRGAAARWSWRVPRPILTRGGPRCATAGRCPGSGVPLRPSRGRSPLGEARRPIDRPEQVLGGDVADLGAPPARVHPRVHASRVEHLDPARDRRQDFLGDRGVRAVPFVVDEKVRPEGSDLGLSRLRRGDPNLREVGANAPNAKRHGLAVHQGREGDEHAQHAGKRISRPRKPATVPVENGPKCAAKGRTAEDSVKAKFVEQPFHALGCIEVALR